MSDPVSRLYDDVLVPAADRAGPATPRALLRRLGCDRTSTAERRQAVLDTWLAAGNEPTLLLADQLRREGFRLPSRFGHLLASAVQQLRVVLVEPERMPSWLSGGPAMRGDDAVPTTLEFSVESDDVLEQPFRLSVSRSRDGAGATVTVHDLPPGVRLFLAGRAFADQIPVDLDPANDLQEWLADHLVVEPVEI